MFECGFNIIDVILENISLELYSVAPPPPFCVSPPFSVRQDEALMDNYISRSCDEDVIWERGHLSTWHLSTDGIGIGIGIDVCLAIGPMIIPYQLN